MLRAIASKLAEHEKGNGSSATIVVAGPFEK
jgi:hypothetical protein